MRSRPAQFDSLPTCHGCLSRHVPSTGHRRRIAQPAGYTLVELLVVMGIMLLLTAMTIGAINLSITGERVRSGGRQIQSVIAGARDRAIYAKEPRGVRILVNEEITEPIDHDNDASTPDVDIPTIATTLVYIGSPGRDESAEDRDDAGGAVGNVSELRKFVQLIDEAVALTPSPPGPGLTSTDALFRAVIGVNTNWTGLYERGLIGPRSRIVIDGYEYPIDPRSFPIAHESDPHNATPAPGERYGGLGGIAANGNNPFESPPAPTDDEIIYLLWDDDRIVSSGASSSFANPYNTESVETPSALNGFPYSIGLESDILPGEEPSVLPRNVCIDLQTSLLTSRDGRRGHFPPSWLTTTVSGGQFSNKMDIVFSPSGAIIGAAGAEGIIHLHISDIGDAIAGTPPGSLTIDGTSTGDPRQGDELGLTIFTKGGRVIVHSMNTDPADPWLFGREGDVAK